MGSRKVLAIAAFSASLLLALMAGVTPAGARAPGTPVATGSAPAQILRNFHLVGHQVPTADTAYSSNWSGYVATGQTYTAVLGYWTVPTATCPTFDFSEASTWVGLDGWGNSTVEQGGTDSGCFAGVPLYYAWNEMYPADEVPLLHPVSPGDHMGTLVISSDGGTMYQIVVIDETQNWLDWGSETASPADQDLSAEWITERPSCPEVCANLTNFGAMTFTSAYATGNGVTGAISAFPNSPVDMDNGNLESQVSTLNAAGNSFTDTWQHE